MIHSLSGGVIRQNGCYTFVKVVFEEALYADRSFWYVCPFSEVEEGSFVLAPVGVRERMLRGKVIKVERGVNEQCAPYPMNRIKEVARLL